MEREEQRAAQALAVPQTRPSRNGSFLPMTFNERQSGIGRLLPLIDELPGLGEPGTEPLRPMADDRQAIPRHRCRP